MTKDSAAPATQQDIALLMEQLGRYYDQTERRIDHLEEQMEAWKQEIKSHFDVVAEDMRHDFQGAFAGKLSQHEDRLRRLERQAGLAAA